MQCIIIQRMEWISSMAAIISQIMRVGDMNNYTFTHISYFFAVLQESLKRQPPLNSG